MELGAAAALSEAGKPLADDRGAGRALQALDASLEAAFAADVKDAAALSAGAQRTVLTDADFDDRVAQ